MTLDSAPVTAFMPFRYDPLVVAVSFVIAAFASYVTLDLARRVRQSTWGLARVWWGAGSVVMGSGIWSMHFVGMQAFEVPITLGYRGGLTLLSWVAAVAASAVALEIASRKTFSYRRVVLGALVMGLGISAMHYIGMAALELVPGIVWNWSLVAASVLIAVLASATALLIFHLLLKVPRQRRLPYQMGAALVMGVAICGMHYTGMIAARIPDSAICLSSDGLGGPSLTAMLTIATGLLLVSTLFTSLLDARMQGTTQRLAQSLQESNAKLQTANAELKQRAFTDPLTGLPNRLLFEERLGQALLRADRANHRGLQSRVAVLFVDLDGFKPVNDRLGHEAGDELLKQVGKRFQQCCREVDTVARYGGDEFVFILTGQQNQQSAKQTAKNIIESIHRTFQINQQSVRIGTSIGIAIYPSDHTEAAWLIKLADDAMYLAKQQGKNRYAFASELR